MNWRDFDPEAPYQDWISEALTLVRELSDRERIALGAPLLETLDVIRRGEELTS